MRGWKWILPLILIAGLTLDWNSNDHNWGITAVFAQSNGQVTISWTPPTQYTDGAPLLEQDLDFYTFYCNGVELAQIDSVIGTWTASVSTASLPEGTHTCTLRVTTLAGAQSGDSNPANFTIGPRVPMAPAGLSLT